MTYIRYFATNRDRENLGRDVSRSTRLKMQKGGYNWIDTKAYMSYYLAETNPDRMPPEALIHASQEPVFDNFIGKPSVRRVLICIHGFNVPLHGAITAFTVLADTLKYTNLFGEDSNNSELIVDPTIKESKQKLNDPQNNLTAVVGFSWPSNGSILNYNSDRTEAATSAPVLANLISVIREANPGAAIFVIAHSMGNFLTCTMLHDLAEQKYTPLRNSAQEKDRLRFRGEKQDGTKFFLDGYFMLAPDVERRHVTKCYKSGEPTFENEKLTFEEKAIREARSSPIPDATLGGNENVYYLGPFFEGLLHLVGGIYLFYSRHDQALKASKVEKEIREHKDDLKEFFMGRDQDNLWEDSLGLNPAPPLAPPNMYSFNASTLCNMQIDHGNYFDSMGIAEKMAKEIVSYNS